LSTQPLFIQHPREILDLLCVASLGTWVCAKTRLGPNGGQPVAHTSHICFSRESEKQAPTFTAVGAFVAFLLHKLAWEDPELRRVAQYFMLVNLPGSGSGRVLKGYKNIFSDEVRARLDAVDLRQGDRWSEWGIAFF
jgi:hypothetical protein